MTRDQIIDRLRYPCHFKPGTRGAFKISKANVRKAMKIWADQKIKEYVSKHQKLNYE